MKKQVKIYLDEDMDKALRNLIASKYQTVERGLISHEISQAIASWITKHAHKDTQPAQVVNPMPRVFAVGQLIKERLKESYGFIPQQVSLSEIRDAIGLVRGNDSRTIDKWLREFAKWKVIKNIGGQVYELP